MIRSSTTKSPSGKARPAPTTKPEVRIFVSYSHKDEGARTKLETHLAQLKRDQVSTWFDGDLNAGEALDTSIARQLRRAHVFVALFSPDYLASKYCWEVEYKRAMGRRARGTMHVIAVLVRPCDWRNTGAAKFKLLPKDGRPVSEWRPADKAYLDVAGGIRAVVKVVRAQLAAVHPIKVPIANRPTSAAKAKTPRAPQPKRPKPPSVRRKSAKREAE